MLLLPNLQAKFLMNSYQVEFQNTQISHFSTLQWPYPKSRCHHFFWTTWEPSKCSFCTYPCPFFLWSNLHIAAEILFSECVSWLGHLFTKNTSMPTFAFQILSKYSKSPTYKPSSFKLSKMQTSTPAPVCQLLYCPTVLLKALYCKIKHVFFVFCLSFYVCIICVKSMIDLL